MVRGGALHSRPPAGLPKRQRPQVHEKGLVPRRDHGPCHGRFYSICRALCLILAGVAATCVTSVPKGEGDPAQLWGSDRGPVGRRPARDAAYRHVTGRELSYLCVFIVSTCTYTARQSSHALSALRSLPSQSPSYLYSCLYYNYCTIRSASRVRTAVCAVRRACVAVCAHVGLMLHTALTRLLAHICVTSA